MNEVTAFGTMRAADPRLELVVDERMKLERIVCKVRE